MADGSGAERMMSRTEWKRRAGPVEPRRAVDVHTGTPSRRFPAWAIAVLLGTAHLGLALLAFDPTPHTGGDNAAYITLARSLLERGAYLELWDPSLRPHTLYPPGFPALLAAAIGLGIDGWVGWKLIVTVLSAAAVAFSYLWLRARAGAPLALAVGVILAWAPGVVELGHWVLSDVPFWMLTALALWAYGKGERGGGIGLGIGIAATVLAYFTRSAGLPLVIAAAAWLALERRWRALALLAAVLLPLAFAWWLRGRGAVGDDYVAQFWYVNPYRPGLGRIGVSDLAVRIWENARNYLLVHLPILVFGQARVVEAACGVVIGGLAFLGWLPRIRRPGVAELFAPLYIGLILVWPAVWSGERFLLPALPLVLFYAAAAVAGGVRRARRLPAALVGAVAVAAVVVLGVPAQLYGARLGAACAAAYRAGDPYPCLSGDWRDFFNLAGWMRERLPEDAVVLSRKPRLFYALSGRQSRIYPLSPDPDGFFAAAEDAGARYVILDHLDIQSRRYLVPILRTRPHAFCVLHSYGPDRTTAFGILPGARSLPDAPAGDAGEIRFGVCPAAYLSSSGPR